MNENYKAIFKTAGILVAICAITATLLSITNAVTHAKIEERGQEAINNAMREVLPADEYKDISTGTDTVYTAVSGEKLGNIYILEEKGYGGNIKVMTAIDTAGTIIKVNILDVSNETPGLGQNTAKPQFYEQFTGKSEPMTVKKDVDAVTGATITSTAVTKAVNRALELDKTMGGE